MLPSFIEDVQKKYYLGGGVSDLQVEECGSAPHGLADLQAVEELGEARGTLVVRGQHFNVHGGDGAPEQHRHKKQDSLTYKPYYFMEHDTFKCSCWSFI